MLSRNLDESLQRALGYAGQRRHEFASLEHLLLSLLEDQETIEVLRACEVDLEKLRDDLVTYLDTELASLITDSTDDPQPTASFRRALQRAVVHVQSSGREEVNGANVLIAIFSESESHAVFFLQEQDMTRFDAVNFLSHGIAKVPGLSVSRAHRSKDVSVKRSRTFNNTIRRAIDLAAQRQHEFATLEHLLLALAKDRDAIAVLRACDVDLDKLCEDLDVCLDNDLDYPVSGSRTKPSPTEGFNSVEQWAIFQILLAGSGKVTGANLLLAIFSERESRAAGFLREHNLQSFDVVKYIIMRSG